jgi:hypothetical protein
MCIIESGINLRQRLPSHPFLRFFVGVGPSHLMMFKINCHRTAVYCRLASVTQWCALYRIIDLYTIYNIQCPQPIRITFITFAMTYILSVFLINIVYRDG